MKARTASVATPPTPHVILDASSMWRCGTHNSEWSVLRLTLRFDGVLSQGRNKSSRLQNRVSRQNFRRTVDWESLEDLGRGVWKGARDAEEPSYWMAPRARGKCVQQRGASSPGRTLVWGRARGSWPVVFLQEVQERQPSVRRFWWVGEAGIKKWKRRNSFRVERTL